MEVGRQRCQVGGHVLDQPQGRTLNLVLVAGSIILEPRPLVVGLQLPQKRKGSPAEVRFDVASLSEMIFHISEKGRVDGIAELTNPSLFRNPSRSPYDETLVRRRGDRDG